MKALVYHGPNNYKWEEVEQPKLQKSSDAIVRIVKTTICGTDLHILKGDVPAVTDGRILGHEGVGIIEEVGSSVQQFKKGDKVIISCITSCGTCSYCKKSLYAHCTDGGWILGHKINGTQAEYVRIPHADNSLYHLPEDLNEESALMLSDILPTGFEIGVLRGQVQPGHTVAIVGSGPIGMASLLTAKFYSPSQIIMIDTDESRLETAKKFGATHTINPAKQDVKAVVNELTNNVGVDVTIECVGIEASFQTCQDIVCPGGNIANVGVHGKPVSLHLEDLWIKNVTITTGLVNTNTTPMLLKTCCAGTVEPNKLVTHHFALNDIDNAYKVFGNAAEEKAIKVVLTA